MRPLGPRHLLVLLTLCAATSASGGAPPATPPAITRLAEVVASDEIEDVESELARAAIDAGPAAFELLRVELAHEDAERSGRAALALAYIGGEQAVDLLREHFRPPFAVDARAVLAFAFASTARAEERALLVSWLEGEHYGDAWTPIVAAALSLGVLRETDALPELEATAAEEDSIAANAAAEAVRWIREGPWTVATGDTRAHPAIVAVLENGIPETDRATMFYDPEQKACWFRSAREWSLGTRSCDTDAPTLSFRVDESADGQRALVAVGVTFGGLDGVGHDYVLSRAGQSWKVRGVFFTWIS